MSGLTYITGSATYAAYNTVMAPTGMQIAYQTAGVPGDVAVVVFISINGVGPTGPMTDTYGQTYIPLPAFNDGSLYIQFFVCLSLMEIPVVPADLVITLPVVAPDSYGGPLLILATYRPADATEMAVQGLQPIGDCGSFCGPQQSISANWNAAQGNFWSTLIAIVFDDESTGGSVRTWSISGTAPGTVASGVRTQYQWPTGPGNKDSGALADAVVGYVLSPLGGGQINSLTFDYSGSTIGQGGQLNVMGIVVTTSG